MAVFEQKDNNLWQPGKIASGPFSGLQGGAVAALLVGEIEQKASEENWGQVITVNVSFLKPTPLEELCTRTRLVISGKRITVVENSVFRADGEVTAVAQITLANKNEINIPSFEPQRSEPVDPTSLQRTFPKAMHGGEWFMDAMEVRGDGQVSWFRMLEDVVSGAGTMAKIVGPADWAHGINRPVRNVVADPNVSLTVQITRPPVDEWLGLEPVTHWEPDAGLGMGFSFLKDRCGVIGQVSMSVVLVQL